MTEPLKPLSSSAEKITATSSVFNTLISYQNFRANAEGHRMTMKSIVQANNEITKRQELQTSILAKQLVVLGKLKDIDETLKSQLNISKSQLGVSNAQLQSSLNIEANQKMAIEIQRQQKLLMEKQVLLNEQQLLVQQNSLATQELQTNIAINNDKLRQKQKELKNTIYSFDIVLKDIQKKEQAVVRHILIGLVKKDLYENKINPNDLEEIPDKQFASQVFYSFVQMEDMSNKELTDAEKEDVKFYMSHKNSYSLLNVSINNIQENYRSINQKINDCESRIEGFKDSIESSYKTGSELKRIIESNKGKDKINIKVPKTIFVVLLISVFITFGLEIQKVYRDNYPFLPVLELILIVSVIICFFWILNLRRKDPSRIIKANTERMAKIENEILNIKRQGNALISDINLYINKRKNIISSLQGEEDQFKALKIEIDNFFNKYPVLRNLS
ncbi:MAG: hypothetical protein NTY74_13850 [Ignavibacteriae bacterium]|nr:hypothetical protein [Ignavibacteriota bacterium]